MGEQRLVVDHLRMNYTGPFDANGLYRIITAFTKEQGYDMWPLKEFEHDTKDGKKIEWQMEPWKRITDYMRYLPRIRVLIFNYKKVEAVVEGKKQKIGHGKVEVYIDGFMELDYLHRWDNFPALQLIRTLYNSFIYKVYTERFEQRLTHDMNRLYHHIEQFFNIYRHYRIVSKAPPFAHTTQ